MPHTNKTKRTSKPKTFRIDVGGHTVNMTIEQLKADKSGWTHCHGSYDGQTVRSITAKPIGDSIAMYDDKGTTACFKKADLAVAFLSVQSMLDMDKASKA